MPREKAIGRLAYHLVGDYLAIAFQIIAAIMPPIIFPKRTVPCDPQHPRSLLVSAQVLNRLLHFLVFSDLHVGNITMTIQLPTEPLYSIADVHNAFDSRTENCQIGKLPMYGEIVEEEFHNQSPQPAK